MQLRVTINLGNDAMQTNHDVAVAMAGVHDKLFLNSARPEADGPHPIRDLNGATVGEWEFVPVEQGGPAEEDGEAHVGSRVADLTRTHKGEVTGQSGSALWIKWDNGGESCVDADDITIIAPDPDDYTAVSQRVGEHEERLAASADD